MNACSDFIHFCNNKQMYNASKLVDVYVCLTAPRYDNMLANIRYLVGRYSAEIDEVWIYVQLHVSSKCDMITEIQL